MIAQYTFMMRFNDMRKLDRFAPRGGTRDCAALVVVVPGNPTLVGCGLPRILQWFFVLYSNGATPLENGRQGSLVATRTRTPALYSGGTARTAASTWFRVTVAATTAFAAVFTGKVFCHGGFVKVIFDKEFIAQASSSQKHFLVVAVVAVWLFHGHAWGVPKQELVAKVQGQLFGSVGGWMCFCR